MGLRFYSVILTVLRLLYYVYCVMFTVICLLCYIYCVLFTVATGHALAHLTRPSALVVNAVVLSSGYSFPNYQQRLQINTYTPTE